MARRGKKISPMKEAIKGPAALPGPQRAGDFQNGDIVDGRFEIIEQIGKGGMASVYRAVQTSIKRPVALKILGARFKRDEFLAARFHNEAALASRLNHPNTVTIFDFGVTDEKDLYIAMELVDGCSLGTELKRQQIITWRRAARIALQIGESLRDAHINSIIHRDLKPENIMLADFQGVPEIVKVLDFGIAKILVDEDAVAREGTTSPNQVFGTPEYMSPEQVASKELDPRTDIYSLGVVLYRMLTGALPFKGDNPILTMSHHLIKAPPPFEVVNPDLSIPSSLVDLTFSMLAKRPEQRPGTMEAVVAQLGDVLALPLIAATQKKDPIRTASSLLAENYRLDSAETDAPVTETELEGLALSTGDFLASTPQPAQRTTPGVCGTETVLIAEDDEMVRHMLCRKLKGFGYNILELEDPRDGIRLAREHDGPVHLLLTDVVMPDMNGRELYQRLSPEFPDLKVLYMSGYTDDYIVHHGVLDDDVEFVHKPVSLHKLAVKLRELLDRPEI